jgi:hypothetical protein
MVRRPVADSTAHSLGKRQQARKRFLQVVPPGASRAMRVARAERNVSSCSNSPVSSGRGARTTLEEEW